MISHFGFDTLRRVVDPTVPGLVGLARRVPRRR